MIGKVTLSSQGLFVFGLSGSVIVKYLQFADGSGHSDCGAPAQFLFQILFSIQVLEVELQLIP